MSLCTTRIQYICMVCMYLRLYIEDIIDHYRIALILLLPPYMFGDPIIHIKQSACEDSDSDSDNCRNVEDVQFDVFIAKLQLDIIDNGRLRTIDMHGLQLRPFVDDTGRFFISNLEKYYPTLTKINMRYVKYKLYNNQITDLSFDVTCAIDTKKKIDTVNNKSCRLGVVF